MSFGAEDVDRYIVVYKKDAGPSDDEIAVRRNGEEWNGKTAAKYAQTVNCDPKLEVCPKLREISKATLFRHPLKIKDSENGYI